MKVVGFTFVRNGVKYNFPFIESLQSLLPICDEVIVAIGYSGDSTLEQIESINSPKVKIIKTIWDDSLRQGGYVLSQQTNIALDHVSGDWAVYLQADEILHENDYANILEGMTRYKNSIDVEGILFHFKHFYGSYNYLGDSRRWYRHEIRIVRPNIGVRSWGDAQGFRIQGRKLRVKLIDASIYHYGWVRPPDIQQLKQQYFNRLWHSDDWIDHNLSNAIEYDYSRGGKLKQFSASHPAVMIERIHNQHWQFIYDHTKIQQSAKEIILDLFEKYTGWRIGEYKNYKLI